MAYPFDLEDEEAKLEGQAAPVSTIAGPQTPREQVMQRIAAVRNSSGDEDQYGPDLASMEFAQGSALNAGIGRALNTLAAGTGAKVDNGTFDAMEKQGQTTMTNSAAVRKAIADRKAKAAAALVDADRFNRKLGEDERHHREMENNTRLLTAASRGERQDRENEKRENEELERAVPGYAPTGTVRASKPEAQKFREAVADSEQLISKLNRMKELVDQYGSFEWGGKGGQEMETLATEIQLLSKGPNLYSLGVLTGPDLKLLERITADPSSLNSRFTSEGTRQTQIDTQLKSLRERLASKAKSLGYAPTAPAMAGPDKVPSSQSSTAPRDPAIETIAQENGLTYAQAEYLMKRRGNGQPKSP